MLQIQMMRTTVKYRQTLTFCLCLFTAICGDISRVAINRSNLQKKFMFPNIHGGYARVSLHQGVRYKLQ